MQRLAIYINIYMVATVLQNIACISYAMRLYLNHYYEGVVNEDTNFRILRSKTNKEK